MARAPDEQMNKAKELYLSGMKLVEIASRLNKPEGTIRRWKSTYNWDNERSDKKSERSERKKSSKKERIEEEILLTTGNSDLNDKQRLFCVLYVKCFNATKAYQKAYSCSYETALTNGPALLGNTRIKNEIFQLKQNRLNREFLSEEDVFQKYMDIAFADITDYLEFGNEEIEVLDEHGHRRKVTISHVNVKNASEVDGTLISEVSKGRNGVKIKLADRMKALNWLAAHMDLATEEQKVRLTIMRRKAAGGDTEAELEKLDQVLAEIKGVI